MDQGSDATPLFLTEDADGVVTTIKVKNVRLTKYISPPPESAGRLEKAAHPKDSQKLIQRSDFKGCLYVTDSRVAFATTKFDSSINDWTFGYTSIFLGRGAGLAIGLAAKAKHAISDRGMVLGGHLRHEWLSGVYAHPHMAIIGQGLRFTFAARKNPQSPAQSYTLEFGYKAPDADDSMQRASEIIRRAAAHKLRTLDGKLSDQSCRQLLELSRRPVLSPPDKRVDEHRNTVYVGEKFPVVSYVSRPPVL